MAGVLLLILGYEALESPIVVIVSTLIPLSLSLGLVWETFPAAGAAYLAFALAGFLAVAITRIRPASGRLALIVLALVHGAAGLTIFGLPLWLVGAGRAPAGFALVGLGGALIGIGGLLLSSLRAGRPLLPKEALLPLLPLLLLLTTGSFVLGFAYS